MNPFLIGLQLAVASYFGNPIADARAMDAKLREAAERREELIQEQKEEYRVLEERRMIVTAYSSRPEETDTDPFITASASRVRWRVVAANALPFGTKVRIPELFGEEIFIVEDRMHKRFQDRVDIWFPSTEVAKRFGIFKDVKIEVLASPPAIAEGK